MWFVLFQTCRVLLQWFVVPVCLFLNGFCSICSTYVQFLLDFCSLCSFCSISVLFQHRTKRIQYRTKLLQRFVLFVQHMFNFSSISVHFVPFVLFLFYFCPISVLCLFHFCPISVLFVQFVLFLFYFTPVSVRILRYCCSIAVVLDLFYLKLFCSILKVKQNRIRT